MQNEEGIYMEFTPVTSGFGFKLGDNMHSYLVYDDGKGNIEVIRGGTTALDFVVGGDIEVENNIPLQKSKDAYKPGETPKTRHRKRIELNGRSPREMWKKFNDSAREIAGAKIDYDLGPRDQNSNSLTRAVLERNGVDALKALPNDISIKRLQGYQNDLSKPYDRIDKLLGNVPNETPSTQPSIHNSTNDDIKGSSGTDNLATGDMVASEDKPEIRDFLKDLNKPEDPVSEILLKAPTDWTEDEVNQVHASDAYQRPGDPRRDEAVGKVRDWYESHYATDPVRTDGTGRTAQPEFSKTPFRQPVPATGADGKAVAAEVRAAGAKIADVARKRGLPTAVRGAGAKIADVARKRGLPTAVRGAQEGINTLRQLLDGKRKIGEPDPDYLRADGTFGVKTKQSFRRSVARYGRPSVENAIALSTFKNLVDNKQGAARGDLGEIAHDSFAPLFEKNSAFKIGDKNSKPWGLAVQDTINDLAGDTPLKADGWIGPKTAAAFERVGGATARREFVKSLGDNFGFF